VNRFLWRIFGVPFGAADRASVFDQMMGSRARESAMELFRDGAQHNTHKSGALLGAQGIFVVVDIFAIDHGWPKTLILASMLLMFLAALLVMTNLRGTLSHFRHVAGEAHHDEVRSMFELVRRRSARFNLALYLTFLSIVLLLVAALKFV